MTNLFHASVAVSDSDHLLATEIFLSYRHIFSPITVNFLFGNSPITRIVWFWIIEGNPFSKYNSSIKNYEGGDRNGI